MESECPLTIGMTTATQNRTVQKIPVWKKILVFPITLLIRLWLRTLRIEADRAQFETINRDQDGYTFALWHNRLMVSSEIRNRFLYRREVGAMVSASKDGAWLSLLFEQLGIFAIRGSTSFRGRQAFREMLVHQENRILAVTPDGPRGPIYQFQRGVSVLSRQAKTPLVLMGVRYCSYWELSSWDRFRIPKPFSKVVIQLHVVRPEDIVWKNDDPELTFRRTLLEVSGETYEVTKAQ
jgi:lysophospholipid acyltransferase (LPLAT)-like uncharacterized protein